MYTYYFVIVIHLIPKKLAVFVLERFIKIYNTEPTKFCDARARRSLSIDSESPYEKNVAQVSNLS